MCFFWMPLSVLDILKLFNPNLVGASLGNTINGMPANIKDAGFNLAVTGANT